MSLRIPSPAGLSFALAAWSSLLIGACSSERQPKPTPSPGTPTTFTVAEESCSDGEEVACKVDVDERNCFVGVRRCEGARWGACVSAGAKAKALSAQADCVDNPCNPSCQQFDEAAPAGLGELASGGGASPGAEVEGLPSGFLNKGLPDKAHTGSDCTVGSCQFDHRCDTSSGNCVAWEDGEFATGAGTPDITAKLICSTDGITLCNRGGVQAPAGIPIDIRHSANPPSFNTGCSGFNGSYDDWCQTTVPIDPGQCHLETTCGPKLGNGTFTVYVNGSAFNPTSPSPIAESECNDNWTMKHSGTECACASGSSGSTVDPVNMYLLVDNSGSMGSMFGEARSAINAFVSDPASASMRVAIRTYDTCQNTCSNAGCGTPKVAMDLLSASGHVDAISAYLATQSANKLTPHWPSVDGALDYLKTWDTANPGEKEVLVYISDGAYWPTTCVPSGANKNHKKKKRLAGYAADAFADPWNIETYTVALPGAAVDLLQAVADSGNASGLMIDLRNSPEADDIPGSLTKALQDIRTQVTPCEVAIPNAGSVDPAGVSAEMWIAGDSGNAVAWSQVAGTGDCASNDQFYVDDNANPTILYFCPLTCDEVKSDASNVVSVTGSCDVGFASTQHTETYHADCTGQVAPFPQWDHLAYEADIAESDGTIVFEVRVADTEVALAAQPWVTAWTASPATEVKSMGDPVVLLDLPDYDADLLQREWLELRMTFNPNSAGSQPSTISRWQVSFSCVDNL